MYSTGTKQEILGAGYLAEPVDAIRVGPEKSLIEQTCGGFEPAANHLELANTLVWLLPPEPLAHSAHRLAQVDVECRQRRHGVLTHHENVVPVLVFPKRRGDAQ